MTELSDYKRLVEKPHVEQLRRTIDAIRSERDMLSDVIADIAKELGCDNDNEAILTAIASLKEPRQ